MATTHPGDAPDRDPTGLLDHRRTPEERGLMLRLLDVTVAALASRVTLPDAALQRESRFAMKTAQGTLLPDFPLSPEEREELSFAAVAIDVERREFYAAIDGRYVGPIGLPGDFHYPALFPDTPRDPAARSPGERVLKQLTSVVNAQEPRVYGKAVERMSQASGAEGWRTLSGTALRRAQPLAEGFALGETVFFFDLDGRRFWIEVEDGGYARGPYKLPSGFQLGNVTALAQVGSGGDDSGER